MVNGKDPNSNGAEYALDEFVSIGQGLVDGFADLLNPFD
jgi:hypothetical protein